MALIESELSIIALEELIGLNLEIPEYQRPYNWTFSSTHTLFMDTYESFKQTHDEYRLGSVILHKKNNVYNIVDGQQRLTTVSILLYCLDGSKQNIGLLNEQYSSHSAKAIINNYRLLMKKVGELKEDERQRFRTYLLKNCTVVKIVTDKEQEAFQFFDSQNSRGKELAPHDLLKSYHLREMSKENEDTKTKIINKWEHKDQRELEYLFKDFLFPLTQWYKKKDGLRYSSNKISNFKGIKSNNTYNYAIYQKAANLFIEQMNHNGSVEILATGSLNQFQLTQPLISGKRFFIYTLHYADLLESIRKKIKDFHSAEQIPEKRTGDYYIKQLYECVLMFFADRFGMNSITESVMKQFYTWSYSLRMVMQAVYVETINGYALGKHERINKDLDLFTKISEMNTPEELNYIIFEKIEKEKVESNIKKYPEVWDLLSQENRW